MSDPVTPVVAVGRGVEAVPVAVEDLVPWLAPEEALPSEAAAALLFVDVDRVP